MIQYQSDLITVFQSELYQTTSTVIEGKKAIVVVDPTWLPNEVAKIRQYVNERINNKQLYLVLTHNDFDHIIGAGAFPEAIIIASEKFTNYPHKQSILDEINEFDQMFYLTRPYEIIYPKVNIIINKHQTNLQLGDLNCIFYLAPGHTDDGLFFYIKKLNTLIVGDYLSDIEFPFITSSYSDYVQTVYLMQEVTKNYTTELLIPGHGKVTSNYAERIKFSLDYLEKIKEPVNIEKQLMKRLPFYEGMKSSHQNNLKLARGSDKID